LLSKSCPSLHTAEAAPPAANYCPYVVTGKYIYIAGQIPMINGELKYVGKVPETYSTDEAYQCARTCGLNILAQAKAACGGDLKKVKQIVKLVGFVNSASDYYDQPKVINGASDLMAEVFGENGRHARSAVGTNVLPLNVATEIEAVIELE
jgi:enamine deaminase RidA (YjgF/YER057c/UK114 family)